MIRNEIGCYNRWGRFAFRWRTYRSMHHWWRLMKYEEVAGMVDILKLCCRCGGIPKIGMYKRKYETAEYAGESVTCNRFELTEMRT